uniref:Putative disease resistance protein RGA4 n=1 Tax=Aegilops tauschii TaxID=37682 RepID=M8BEX7_AEGTA
MGEDDLVNEHPESVVVNMAIMSTLNTQLWPRQRRKEKVGRTEVWKSLEQMRSAILGTLRIDKLDAWIRQAGLADDIERLRREVERVEVAVSAVRGRAAANEPLARSLARLKDLLYEADEVVDDLDYCRLQQQVQGVAWGDPGRMHEAERVDERSRGGDANILGTSGGKKWSKAWCDFDITEENNGKPVKAKFKHCQNAVKCGSDRGTSILNNHVKSEGCKNPRGTDQPPNSSCICDATANAAPVVIGDLFSRKRRRDEELAQTTAANINLWHKADCFNRIQEITQQLQDILEDVSGVLKMHGSASITSSNDVCPTTSSLNQQKVYGRDSEMSTIIKMITSDKHEGVSVLPIVGIGGVGKTTLTQLVYNDPTVKEQFERKWLWVSNSFDEVRLTREMLDFISQESHEGINDFAKLQEILKVHMEFQSERFLLILDDVWDTLDDYLWNKLLSPMLSTRVKGNVIIITTRNFSVAQRIGTLEPVNLGALANDDFWLLFKSRAFGDENYEEHQTLGIIGHQIAEKLMGNPLAAGSAGELLRKQLTVDHWSNPLAAGSAGELLRKQLTVDHWSTILKNECWKSLQLSRGIMSALKLSYDQLPYHLQQCCSYVSIFPYNHQFLGDELVRIWISQGFVNCNHSGFFQQVECKDESTRFRDEIFVMRVHNRVVREEPFQGRQTSYAMCGLMHDFGRVVSRNECAIIDDLWCNEILPTVQHLSIVTDSAYCKNQDGRIPRSYKFEENLRNTVTSVRRLRTLVLIGQYDSFFFQSFQDIFKKAHNLRLLQMSATASDFSSFVCTLVNPTHLRYLKAPTPGVALPQVLSKFYHLQVLDTGSYIDPMIPNGIHNLVSLRHIVVEGLSSSIPCIGKMTSLLELHDFRVQNTSSFEITQLQSMNELLQLGVSRLENVTTKDEADGAKLRDKIHLEKLRLSWKYNDHSGKAREVLEGLEPHPGLKHLRIFGYNGTTSPTWLASNFSVTSLQTLHLEDCGEWQILPSLEMLPFLTKLTLCNMQKVMEAMFPSLEELVLVEMPKLEKCSCSSLWDMNSSLRVLNIKMCSALKVFDLLDGGIKFESKQKSWLPGLRKLIIYDCPHLEVMHPLPPSTTCSEFFINRVSTLPRMEGSSGETLKIDGPSFLHAGWFYEMWTLDDRILAFHNLRGLKYLCIRYCRNLMSIPFEGFCQLVSLKSLEISNCGKHFSLDIPECAHEDVVVANCTALPSLENLRIYCCGITGKWLSLMLRHATALMVLSLWDCPQITQLSIEEGENSQSNLISTMQASSSGYSNDSLTSSAPDGLLHIPLNVLSSLKEMEIREFPYLTFCHSKEGLSGFTSLEKLTIWSCPELLSSSVRIDGNDGQVNGSCLLPQSLGHLEIADYSRAMLQPCFPRNLTCLKKLQIWSNKSLESLQLQSCTALEELHISGCPSLAALEGFQFLRHLSLFSTPNLPPFLEHVSRQGYELCPQLEKLVADNPCVLTTPFCKQLTSLQRLELRSCESEATRLTDEQAGALLLITSLEELQFWKCRYLVDLPAELHRLPSLKKLEIDNCHRMLWLPAPFAGRTEYNLPWRLQHGSGYSMQVASNKKAKGQN